ncbi:ATP-dependent RNA helicase DDX55-like [Tetranychus urticae]|uniref:ATP-dependent RNA helicase n=1 Tax=Tetranychus urticae TaxID=32264 RepID=T1L1U9_TETUR|nr:ATP-dependent RNA helicase DDX55-like [Tetranychus urticae]
MDNFDWDTLSVDERILNVIRNKFKFKQMTPVQKAVIPLFTGFKDVCCEAVTGSGKSLAFIVSVLDILIKQYEKEPFNKHAICGLIISPTRELSTQTFDVLEEFLSDSSFSEFLNAQLFIGGNNPIIDGENYLQNGGNIFVVTPGRMVDLLEKYPQIGIKLRKHLQVLVIDETDVLLDMGFDKEVNEILSYLPKQRRTGLFSATQTKLLSRLVKLGLRNPIRIEIKEKKAIQLGDSEIENSLSSGTKSLLKSTGLQISPYLSNNYVILESNTHKLPFLVHFVKKNPTFKYILFFSTCAQVDYFAEALIKFLPSELTIFKLHRKLKSRRQKIFNKFKSSENGSILICTDIMSRGIDIPEIDWVINVDLPNTIQDYIHRSGRSGHQIGIQGNSMILCLQHEDDYIKLCQEKGIDFTQMKVPKKKLLPLADEISSWLRQHCRDNAEFYENSMKAFVSFIRNYSTKNMMSSILFQSMDWIDLANSFGLLKVPIMPELRKKLAECPTKLLAEPGDKEIANSHKKALEKLRSKGNQGSTDKVTRKNQIKVTEQRAKMKAEIKLCKLKGKKKKRFLNEVEFDELAEDARMVKKLKKGKITQADFDKHFGID